MLVSFHPARGTRSKKRRCGTKSGAFLQRLVSLTNNEHRIITSAMGWASHRKKEEGSNAQYQRVRREARRPKEDLRLSERLVDLIAPYRADGLTPQRHEMLIGAAATAWNLSLLPETERPEALREAVRSAKVREVEAIVEVIGTLMRRKEQLFPDDHRTIMSWEVSESGGQCHVTVASLVE